MIQQKPDDADDREPSQAAQPTLLGDDQWSCYWEWAWQSCGGHRYMHNPSSWGVLQFAEAAREPLCRNAEWPARCLSRGKNSCVRRSSLE